MPAPTPAWSSSRSILRAWASASGSVAASPPGGIATRWPPWSPRSGCRTAPRSSSASGRGRSRTGRWTGRSGGRCCCGCWRSVLCVRPRRRGAPRAARACCSDDGTRVGRSAASTVRKPARSSASQARSGRPRRSRSGRGGPAGRRTRRAGAPSSSGRPGRGPGGGRRGDCTTTVTGSRRTAAGNRRRATDGGDRGAEPRTGPRRGPASAAGRCGRVESMVMTLLVAGGVGRGWTRQSPRPEPDAVGIRIRSGPADAGGCRAPAPQRGRAPAQPRPARDRAEHGAVVGVQRDRDVQPLAGCRDRELVACRRCRGTARRTSACRCAPGPARRGGRGRRAGRRRCCAPRRRWPPGAPSPSKHQKTLIGLKQCRSRAGARPSGSGRTRAVVRSTPWRARNAVDVAAERRVRASRGGRGPRTGPARPWSGRSSRSTSQVCERWVKVRLNGLRRVWVIVVR